MFRWGYIIIILYSKREHLGCDGCGVVCVDVWRSVWAAVDCGVREKVGRFGHLLYNAMVCVWMVKLLLSSNLFNTRI